MCWRSENRVIGSSCGIWPVDRRSTACSGSRPAPTAWPSHRMEKRLRPEQRTAPSSCGIFPGCNCPDRSLNGAPGPDYASLSWMTAGPGTAGTGGPDGTGQALVRCPGWMPQGVKSNGGCLSHRLGSKHFSQGRIMGGKSSCTVRQTTLILTPKYSCESLLRIPPISRHASPGWSARTSSGTWRAASPIISKARTTAYTLFDLQRTDHIPCHVQIPTPLCVIEHVPQIVLVIPLHTGTASRRMFFSMAGLRLSFITRSTFTPSRSER